MNPKYKRRIKLLLTVLAIVPVLLAVIVWLLPPEKYTLTTIQTDEYYHRLFNVRQPTGKYVPMVSVFWGVDKTLSVDDTSKILTANSAGYSWTAKDDDSDYTRWYRSDGKLGATYRKKDNKLVIYRKEFAEWQNRYGKINKGLIQKVME